MIIQVLGQGVHQENSPLSWVAITSWLSDGPELSKDKLNSLSHLFKIIRTEKLVNWEVSQKLVVVSSSL